MARRYVRDNRGRFASKGAGATARGGRLKTAGGSKRQTQTMKAGGAKPAGAIKGKVKRDPAAATRVGQSGAAKPRAGLAAKSSARQRGDTASVNIPMRGARGRALDRDISNAVKQVEAAQTAALMKPKAQVKAERAAAAKAKRQAAAAKPKRTRTPESLRMSRAKQIEKRRSITTNPAGERASSAAKMAANAARTQERATAFLKAGGKTKPAAAAKPAAKRRRTISPEKTARVAQRVNAVTAGAAAKSGVKRMNATEVGVRAKAFLTRKAGGMSGMVGKNFAEQQAVVRSGLTNRPRYSTQKPNRNKPLRYNALGQDKARTAARIASQTPATPKPAASKPASRMIGRRELIGRNTATGKAPTSAKARRIASTMRKPAPKTASNTGRRQPLRGGAAFARNPKGFQGLPVIARTKRESGAVQRFRRESILERTRQMGTRKNPRIRKQQTGMSQLSLMGKATPLVRFRPVKR